LFLSLFVSMLTVLYGEYVQRESIYQMLEKLKIRPVTQADKEYSVLISVPAPLNVMLLFLAPFQLTSANPELWNKTILAVAYLPILIGAFAVFTAYNIILLPICFVKVFFHKMIMIFVYSKSHRVTRADKFMLWIFFLVSGIPRLLVNFLSDEIAFLMHCAQTDLTKHTSQIRKKPLTKPSLNILSNYFTTRNERLIPFKQVAAEIRDDMSIFQKISVLFNPQPFINFFKGSAAIENEEYETGIVDEKQFNEISTQIREYSTVKFILEGNDEYIVYKKQRVKSIDCKVMNVLIEDVIRQKTMAKVEDENFIFIRRAVDVKSRKKLNKRANQRAAMGADVFDQVARPETNIDQEDRHAAEKRNKFAVKKLIHCKTARLLEIIGYSTTESDVRRLEYAIQMFGEKDKVLK